jgi:hypothetical protein
MSGAGEEIPASGRHERTTEADLERSPGRSIVKTVPQAIWKLAGNPVGALRVMTWTTPRRMLIMPSVVMKG